MSSHVQQAFKDFHEFLSGRRAPALIGQSLAAVIVQDPRVVAANVANWAYTHPVPNQFASLITARNKVFDIFFYRVVRFRRIFDFFDAFEQSLVEIVPEADRARLGKLLAEFPWRDIRPHGSFRDPLEYALEKRRHSSAQHERFNAGLYRNTTHEILSVDKRHTFDDEQTATLVSLYQNQLAGVFDDFVDLIKDPEQRREILLANTADKHAAYATKSRFDIANYISHLMEFVIALINDDFFEHGIEAFCVVRQIHKDFKVDIGSMHWQRFRAHSDLINRQKLGESSASPLRAVLLRSFLPLFEAWNPPYLLNTILNEQDRRARKLAVALLCAYGSEVYQLVVERLITSAATAPWYYARNLAYILGRIVTGNDRLRHRAVVGLTPYLDVSCVRQLNVQVAAALGFIATPEAVAVLIGKLDEFGARLKDPDCAEACNKIISTLFGVGTDEAVAAAGEFCLAKNLVAQHREDFARAPLPESLRAHIVSRVNQEIRKVRITRSLLGSASTACTLIAAIGHSGYPDVDELCRSIVSSFPQSSQLASESSRLLATNPPPATPDSDRILHAYLSKMDLPQALCYALDAGTSGRIDVATRDGRSGSLDLLRGRVVAAEIADSLIEKERAVFWLSLLEPRDVAEMQFTPGTPTPSRGAVDTPAEDLLRDILFQRAEVRQIVDGLISPESRFRRREVHSIYSDFSRLDEPGKYVAVWRALAQETDVKRIGIATGLSRHDVFRILLFFHRRNMLAVDDGRGDESTARLADNLSTIAIYIRRIEERPLQFRFYHTAADGCAALGRLASDEVIRKAASALGGYLLDAYSGHRAFGAESVEVCRRTVDLISRYHKEGNAADRQELLDYIGFTFAAESPAINPAVIASNSLLEQLENIDYCNDAYDTYRNERDQREVAALLEAVKDGLAASGVSVAAIAAGERATATEAKIMLEVFTDVATGFSKPIKDFVRELRRCVSSGIPISFTWLMVIESSVDLLRRVVELMDLPEISACLERIARALYEQKASSSRAVSIETCDVMLAVHRRLAELAPLAFGLELSDEQLAVKRSELLASFILRQEEGVTAEVLDRLSVAGLITAEAYFETVPEDISVTAEIDPALSEKIFLSFHQYRDLVGHASDPAANPKYAAMFDIGLTTIKEICVRLERIALDEHRGKETDQAKKARLVADRQRALSSVLALLCARGQYDRIEQVQTSPFENRVQMLDEYYAELLGASLPQSPPPQRPSARRPDDVAA